MRTKAGHYRVSFSIPVYAINNFVSFAVEDVEDLAHARQIERLLLDGGARSVYVSLRTSAKKDEFLSVGPNTLPVGSVDAAARAMMASWRRGDSAAGCPKGREA